jgi:hypothetical protein
MIGVLAERSLPKILAAGGLALALLASPLGTTAATYYVRYVSCSGAAFQPLGEGYVYTTTTDGTKLADSSNATWACDPSLPHGALLTKLQVTMADFDTQGHIECTLMDVNMLASSLGGSFQVTVQTSDAEAPGWVRRGVTIPNYAVADDNNGYLIRCSTFSLGTPNNLGVRGANVTFKITAAKG